MREEELEKLKKWIKKSTHVQDEFLVDFSRRGLVDATVVDEGEVRALLSHALPQIVVIRRQLQGSAQRLSGNDALEFQREENRNRQPRGRNVNTKSCTGKS